RKPLHARARSEPTPRCGLYSPRQWSHSSPGLRSRTINPDGGGVFKAGANTQQQAIHFGDEEARSRACHGGHPRDARVLRVVRLQNVDRAGPADHINATALLIHEQIVRVSTDIDFNCQSADVPVERSQFWGISESNEHALAFEVES